MEELEGPEFVLMGDAGLIEASVGGVAHLESACLLSLMLRKANVC